MQRHSSVHTKFLYKSLKGRGYLVDTGIDGGHNIKMKLTETP
jgi:tRNA splicing endonuclease